MKIWKSVWQHLILTITTYVKTLKSGNRGHRHRLSCRCQLTLLGQAQNYVFSFSISIIFLYFNTASEPVQRGILFLLSHWSASQRDLHEGTVLLMMEDIMFFKVQVMLRTILCTNHRLPTTCLSPYEWIRTKRIRMAKGKWGLAHFSKANAASTGYPKMLKSSLTQALCEFPHYFLAGECFCNQNWRSMYKQVFHDKLIWVKALWGLTGHRSLSLRVCPHQAVLAHVFIEEYIDSFNKGRGASLHSPSLSQKETNT